MSDPSIPVVDVRDWHGDAAARARFVRGVGESLADIGFFALANHGIAATETQRAYATAREFFALPGATKARYHRAGAKGQRGYTGFGTEHAKDAKAADLKEFWQVGRVDVPDDHEVHQPFGPNLWPDADVPAFQPVMSALYRGPRRPRRDLPRGRRAVPRRARRHLRGDGHRQRHHRRVIYYPPTVGAPPGAVRSAAHEDINLITLLSGATADGLELLRRDGTWMPVHVSFDHIVVDSRRHAAEPDQRPVQVDHPPRRQPGRRVVRSLLDAVLHPPAQVGRPLADGVGGGPHRRRRPLPRASTPAPTWRSASRRSGWGDDAGGAAMR
jgi:hypothetical protein